MRETENHKESHALCIIYADSGEREIAQEKI